MSVYYGIGDGKGGYYLLNEVLVGSAIQRGDWIVVSSVPFQDGDTLNLIATVDKGPWELRRVKPKKVKP